MPSTEKDPTPPPSAPPLTESDTEAEAAASAARDQGTALIREHLDSHLAQNPGSSYVSWIATLHPENASVTIDPRFHVPGNPWLSVFEEGKRDVYDPPRKHPAPSAPPPPEPAVSYPVVNDTPTDVNIVQPDNLSNVESNTDSSQSENLPKKAYGGLLDLAMGLAIQATAFGCTMGIELISTYVYLSCVLCWRLSRCFSSPRVTACTALPFGTCCLLYQLFRLMDFVLLFVSVLVVEVLACMACLVCAMLSLNWDVGQAAHQRTRKTAHLARWAFRRPLENWEPQRSGGHRKNDDENPSNVVVVTSAIAVDAEKSFEE